MPCFKNPVSKGITITMKSSTSSEKYIKTEALDENSEFYSEYSDRNENNTNEFYKNSSNEHGIKIEPKDSSEEESVDGEDDEDQTTDPKLLLNPVVKIEISSNQKLENSKDYSHLSYYKRPKIKTHRCNSCKKSFGYVKNLEKHVKIFHADGDGHQCKHCKKCFGNQPMLNKHVKEEHKEHIGHNHLLLLMADLRQDIKRVSSFSRCLNGTFPRRNCSVKLFVH